jgi:hypothetical protein
MTTGSLLSDDLLSDLSSQSGQPMDSSRVLLGLMELSRRARAAEDDPRAAAALRAPLVSEQNGYHELRAGLVLMTMTFIALPLLPDRAIGPFGGISGALWGPHLRGEPRTRHRDGHLVVSRR